MKNEVQQAERVDNFNYSIAVPNKLLLDSLVRLGDTGTESISSNLLAVVT